MLPNDDWHVWFPRWTPAQQNAPRPPLTAAWGAWRERTKPKQMQVTRAYEKSLCMLCGENLKARDSEYCAACETGMAEKRARQKEYDARKRQAREMRLCCRCYKQPRVPHQSYCQACNRVRCKTYYHRTRGKYARA